MATTTTMPKKPEGDAKWYAAMIKLRNAILGRNKKKTNNCKPAGIDNSNGVSWIRGPLLGKGGYARVFVAVAKKPVDKNSKFPGKIAVKSADINHASTLMLEKRILCDLKASPYVVTCYGAEVTRSGDGERFYNLLLEYCVCSLLDRINKWGGALPESEVKCYTRDIVGGLKDIHSRHYVHCDLKPDNILLVPDAFTGRYRAKIADFGAADVMGFDEDEFDEVDDFHVLKGTYNYMSPELVRNKKVGYPMDIWALGCVVLEMLSGKPVWGFQGGNRNDSDINLLLHRIAYTTDIPEIPSYISKEAKDFLEKCFARSLPDRWSANMLIEHPFLVDKC